MNLTPAEIDELVRAAFHAAWGRAHDLPGYDKKAWSYVQLHLDSQYRDQPKTGPVPDADGKLHLAGGAIVIQLPKR